LLFVHDGALIAQPFDWQNLELSGERAVIVLEIGYQRWNQARFSVSSKGVLLYQAGCAENLQLTWLDRQGKSISGARGRSPQLLFRGKNSFHDGCGQIARARESASRRRLPQKGAADRRLRSGGGKFTSPLRQQPVNDLSESAVGKNKKEQQEDPQTVLSGLAGHVEIRDGSARLQNVSFDFPGASAQMEGTYNLLAKTVNIRGTLRTNGKLADTTSGFKAMMLKAVTPFLKRQHKTVAPFTITGSTSNPTIGLAF
jgi:hypothetical protein